MTNYLQTSYQLKLSTAWFSRLDLSAHGQPYTEQSPLLVMQTVQVDLNSDGLDDVFTYDSYPLDIQTPNPPPSVFINRQGSLEKSAWQGPTLRNPHGVKILVGDFNGDGLPDLFSLVAVDPPHGAFPDLLDFNNLLFNSPAGFNQVIEFDDQRGFWYAGTSGDIDRDGDLDVVMFNFHVARNGVQSKILWNDGSGGFRYDSSGIGSIPFVDQAELVDVDGDGLLDLIIDNVEINPVRKPTVSVIWGNGSDFQPGRAAVFTLESDQFLLDLAFADLDGDGRQEIFVASVDDAGRHGVQAFKFQPGGTGFRESTADYFTENRAVSRFDHLLLQDIDGNGRLDLYAPDRADNIRWEWDGAKFARFTARGDVAVTGTLRQGEMLSARPGFSDGDGMGPVTYLWQISEDAKRWTDAGTGPQRSLVAADSGHYLRLIASYTDGQGTRESLMTGTLGPVGALLNGSDGPDRLTGAAGNDRIDGLGGVDLAVYSGPRSAYDVSVAPMSGSLIILDTMLTRDGIDTVMNVERLRFNDGALAFDLDGHAGQVARILGALFGPSFLERDDLAGVGLALLDAGVQYPDLIAAAVGTDVFVAAAGGRTNLHFVDHVFNNVAGRAPNADEQAHFIGVLDRGEATQSGLALMACELDLTAQRVDLVGLAAHGLPYIPPEG